MLYSNIDVTVVPNDYRYAVKLLGEPVNNDSLKAKLIGFNFENKQAIFKFYSLGASFDTNVSVKLDKEFSILEKFKVIDVRFPIVNSDELRGYLEATLFFLKEVFPFMFDAQHKVFLRRTTDYSLGTSNPKFGSPLQTSGCVIKYYVSDYNYLKELIQCYKKESIPIIPLEPFQMTEACNSVKKSIANNYEIAKATNSLLNAIMYRSLEVSWGFYSTKNTYSIYDLFSCVTGLEFNYKILRTAYEFNFLLLYYLELFFYRRGVFKTSYFKLIW